MATGPTVWTPSSIAMLQGISEGWIPMTRAGEPSVVATYQTRDAYATANQTIQLEYDYVSWGGTGGSGHSLYLFDPGVPGAGTGGAADGAGYRGLVGAYVGIVFDVDGNYVIESFDSIYGPTPQELTCPTATSRQDAIDAGCVKHVLAAFVPDAAINRYRVTLFVNNVPIFGYVPHGFAFATPIPASLKFGISAANGSLTSNQELRGPSVVTKVGPTP